MALSVLFINPVEDDKKQYGFTTPNIGLTYLSAVTKQLGHRVFTYDMQLDGNNESRFLSLLESMAIDVVCVTLTTMTSEYATRLLPKLRAVLPDALYVCGDPHPPIRALPAFESLDLKQRQLWRKNA